jgi:hypothetical protein
MLVVRAQVVDRIAQVARVQEVALVEVEPEVPPKPERGAHEGQRDDRQYSEVREGSESPSGSMRRGSGSGHRGRLARRRAGAGAGARDDSS